MKLLSVCSLLTAVAVLSSSATQSRVLRPRARGEDNDKVLAIKKLMSADERTAAGTYIPWRCYVKQTDGRICSGAIIASSWVVVKSSCLINGNGRLEVHAGAPTEGNSIQKVEGQVYQSNGDPTPEGILVIRLNAALNFDGYSTFAVPLPFGLESVSLDGKYGFVSGFRKPTSSSSHRLEYFISVLYEKECSEKLCAYEFQDGKGYPTDGDYHTKATDFLDNVDLDNYYVYFVGVLKRDGESKYTAMYYPVTKMLPWFKRNIPGIENQKPYKMMRLDLTHSYQSE